MKHLVSERVKRKKIKTFEGVAQVGICRKADYNWYRYIRMCMCMCMCVRIKNVKPLSKIKM
jgi:hypothetical protein